MSKTCYYLSNVLPDFLFSSCKTAVIICCSLWHVYRATFFEMKAPWTISGTMRRISKTFVIQVNVRPTESENVFDMEVAPKNGWLKEQWFFPRSQCTGCPLSHWPARCRHTREWIREFSSILIIVPRSMTFVFSSFFGRGYQFPTIWWDSNGLETTSKVFSRLELKSLS